MRRERRRERGGREARDAAGEAAGSAAARDTPNTAPGPRVASAPSTAALLPSHCELAPLPAPRRPRSLGPTCTHSDRPALAGCPGPRQTWSLPHPEGARSNPNARQRSEHKAGRRKAPVARSPSKERSRPALTAPRSRRPALAPTRPGRRCAPPPSLLPPAGREGPNMAARGPPGAAMAAPEPGRCAHFVLRKRRFCRMIAAHGRRFCGEHGHEEVQGPFSGREGGQAGSGWPRSGGTGGRGSACAFP